MPSFRPLHLRVSMTTIPVIGRGGGDSVVSYIYEIHIYGKEQCTVVSCSAVRACMRCGAQCTWCRLGEEIVRVSGQNSPVVKHALWKGLATSVGAEVSHEPDMVV